jgi:UDP-N-acetyl-alpha-D-muramoyl-L-alanyl-L-glutamate epimerase
MEASMQDKFMELREKHSVFTYDKYDITDQGDKLVITYYFNIEGLATFTPKWEFRKKHVDINYEKEEIVNQLAFQLGLVELISYWKCACPPFVHIKAGKLDQAQIDWWKQQYFLGLGEFFYTNGIETSAKEFMKVEIFASDDKKDYYKSEKLKNGCMIPIGGGKDSVVTLELLSDRKESNLCFMVNKKLTSIQCATVAGYKEEDILIVNRSLDGNLLALNKEGYLNGHTPFSAIVAFSSVLSAYLHDKEYVVLSNEASANESTVEGTEVNHQYSKTYKFELDFIHYEKKYVNSGVHYFSLLRPFSEFQIAKFFAKQEKYHFIFHSCNVGSKKDLWCGACSKCLFVYIILSPFIDSERLAQIFGNDMLNQEELIPIFDKLIGAAPEKPFECVGTCDEVNTAICMEIHRYNVEGKGLPKLYEYYKGKEQYKTYLQAENPYLYYYNEENSVPEEMVHRLKSLML